MLGFQQARKIEDTPFPFPYAQLLAFMLYAFGLLFPFLAASKVGARVDVDELRESEAAELEAAGYSWFIAFSHISAPALTFVVMVVYFGMHEVARDLEDPFIHPPNDLPAADLQRDFNARLVAAWDGCQAGDAGGGFGGGEMLSERALTRSVDSLLRERKVRQREGARDGDEEPSAAAVAPDLLRQKSTPNRFWETSATASGAVGGGRSPRPSREPSGAGALI